MKKFNKIFLTLAAVLSFASCQEDLGLDVYENHLYLTSSEKTKLLYVSTEYSYTEVINASIAKPAEEDVNILYDVDEDLVDSAELTLTREFHCWFLQLGAGVSCERNDNGSREWDTYIGVSLGLTAMPGAAIATKYSREDTD